MSRYKYAEEDAAGLQEKLEKALNAYLQVPDAKELLTGLGDPLLFGGAVRDTLAGDEIQDLDILCGPRTKIATAAALRVGGYELDDSKCSSKLPTRLNFSVARFEKTHANGKTSKIDVISIERGILRDRFHDTSPGSASQRDIKELMIKMVANVDIVACACAYSATGGLLEFIPGAIKQAKNKIIEVRKDNLLHNPTRAEERVQKLQERGWKVRAPKPPQAPEADPEMGF